MTEQTRKSAGGGGKRRGREVGRETDREGRKGQEKTLSEDKILGKFSFYLLYISF